LVIALVLYKSHATLGGVVQFEVIIIHPAYTRAYYKGIKLVYTMYRFTATISHIQSYSSWFCYHHLSNQWWRREYI